MKVLITGANGQLGTALSAVYPDAITTDSSTLDITDREAILDFDWSGVDAVINAAAFTNVDGAESAKGRVSAWRVNAEAVVYLADAARIHDFTLVHVSSDYVFDGSRSPHPEDEPFSPLSTYGASKAAGDIAASLAPKNHILRTSWVVGEGKNFVRTMLNLGDKGVSPTVVADQIGRLTFTQDLAAGIKHLLDTNAPFGIYNLSNSGPEVSWADITREIFRLKGFNALSVTDTTTEEYYAGKFGNAPRPSKSTLDLAKIETTGFKPRSWQQALQEYIEKEQA